MARGPSHVDHNILTPLPYYGKCSPASEFPYSSSLILGPSSRQSSLPISWLLTVFAPFGLPRTTPRATEQRSGTNVQARDPSWTQKWNIHGSGPTSRIASAPYFAAYHHGGVTQHADIRPKSTHMARSAETRGGCSGKGQTGPTKDPT